jgi:hypothetical protein
MQRLMVQKSHGEAVHKSQSVVQKSGDKIGAKSLSNEGTDLFSVSSKEHCSTFYIRVLKREHRDRTSGSWLVEWVVVYSWQRFNSFN